MWCACVFFPNSSLSKSDDSHKRKRKQLDNHLFLCGQWSKAQSGSNHRTLLRWIKLDVKITWKPMLAQKHIHMQYRDNIGEKKIIYTVCVFIADFLKQINNKWLFELEKISLVPVNCVLTKCNHLFLIPAQHQGFLGPVLFLWKLYHSFQFSFYLTTMHISIKSFAQLAYKCITVILHFIFI